MKAATQIRKEYTVYVDFYGQGTRLRYRFHKNASKLAQKVTKYSGVFTTAIFDEPLSLKGKVLRMIM